VGKQAGGAAAVRSTSARAPARRYVATRATFSQVFAVGEFRALWLAMLLSVGGDQLARIAMTVLVYVRTRSPLLTALTYAMTLLPWLVGGLGLSGLADRLPRRRVMIACDLARMALVLLMAAVSLSGSAVAFHWADMTAGVQLVFRDSTLRTLMLFGWLVTFYVVPMGLAAPYAAGFPAPPLAVGTGFIYAAIPFGTAIGTFILGRLVSPARRQRWMGGMAIGSCAVLMLCGLHPGFPASIAIFTAAGAFAGYQIAANAAFVVAVPAERRGQAFGLANGGMQVFQGGVVHRGRSGGRRA
jgi:hypothetical protein